MQNSLERVRTVIRGGIPDRPPLYDLLRNDAVIGYFSGVPLTVDNGPDLVYRAYAPALDATRPWVRPPQDEAVERLADGRLQHRFRWTTWTEPRRYADSEAYGQAKRAAIEAFDERWTAADQAALQAALDHATADRQKLGEVFYFPGIIGPGLMGLIGEVGLEAFSYYLADWPDLIPELLECNTQRAVTLIRHYPEDHGIEAGFSGDDIAFHSGPLLSPAWLRQHYMPRLKRCLDAWHAQGVRVLFHSDGNLNPILDDLVEAGIDGLNPIEVLAGMHVADIHRRHPKLFLAGGIDVSQLLPFGTPQQIRDTVHRAIDDAEGRLLVGSTTELNNDVPLANYLALREAVLDRPYG
jgi:hypothetical protein